MLLTQKSMFGLEDAAESGVCSPAAGSSEPGSGAERPPWALRGRHSVSVTGASLRFPRGVSQDRLCHPHTTLFYLL